MNNETSYFLFQIISFKKYFYVSFPLIFYCFCGGPVVVDALGSCPVCPPSNPALYPCVGKQLGWLEVYSKLFCLHVARRGAAFGLVEMVDCIARRAV